MRKKIRSILLETDYTSYDNDSNQPFWGNIGAGILVYCSSTQRFLIDHRSEFVNEPNTYGVFGGKLDEGVEENIKETAQREFVEETGFKGSIKLIPAYIYKTSGFQYHNFIGIIDKEFTPRNSWESQGHLWLDWNDLQNLNNKHFGLTSLLKNSQGLIQKIIKEY